MSLAQRLLLAIAVVTVSTTLALSLAVREAWRRTEEERFGTEFDRAVARLEVELTSEIRVLPQILLPLCEHDPVLDAALVDLRTGRLDASRRLALSLRIPELMKAFRLDELKLVTGDGEILGAGQSGVAVGSVDDELARKLTKDSGIAKLRSDPRPLAIEAHCRRKAGNVVIGLFGARHFQSLLNEVGDTYGVSLSSTPPEDDPVLMMQAVQLDQLGGTRVYAARSRVPLRQALRALDVTIVLLGIVVIGLALVVVWLLARGLARPIVDLAEQARLVVSGEPSFVEGRGGRELIELAESFNRAIRDLTDLRKRLAATERIAARREIARRVAHEIKNPLAPIRAAVETLRRLRVRADPAFDEYFDEATRTVLDEVARITNIVQEFTRFARLPPPNPGSMNLTETVRDVVRLHSTGEIPIVLEATPDVEIRADRDQVVQVMTNLVQNALDAVQPIPNGRVVVAVRCPDALHAEVTVQDNGPGVSAEIRDRLFEPYATNKEHGTGLGLAIAQRIAVEHGGSLEYRPAGSVGAVFTVVLPLGGPTLLPEPPPSN